MNLLEISNLNKNFKNNKILSEINLTIKRGAIVAIVGPNGAGKTTLFRIINNSITPDSGCIKRNCEVSGIVSIPGLYPFLTGRENLELINSLNNNKFKIQDIINFIGINNAIDKKVNTYSLGMKQRLALGTTLLSDSELIILDEPFNGIDIESRKLLLKKIVEIKEKQNKSIIISSHLLNEIQSICDNVIFLKNGTIVKSIDLRKESDCLKYKFELENTSIDIEFLNKIDYVKKYFIKNNNLIIYCKKNKIYYLTIELINRNIYFNNIINDTNIIGNEYDKLYLEE